MENKAKAPLPGRIEYETSPLRPESTSLAVTVKTTEPTLSDTGTVVARNGKSKTGQFSFLVTCTVTVATPDWDGVPLSVARTVSV